METARSPQEHIGNDDRYIIPNLDRALRVLELLGEAGEHLSVSSIASKLGIPQNSAFRIGRTLEARGYVVRDPDTKTFQLTPKLFTVGAAAAGRGHNLVEAGIDPIRRLRDATRETVLLGSLLGAEGVVLEQSVGTHTFKFMVDPGLRFPLHTAAPGKAMLAALPESEAEAILSRMTLRRFTDRTITTKKAFREELAVARETGFGVDRGEEEDGQHCVGVAVLDSRGLLAGAVWITAPSSRLHESQF